MSVQAVFYERSNLDLLKYVPYEMKVKQYSWNVFGGPEEMICYHDFGGSNDALLWSMVNNLMCGVEVVDDKGRSVWWGYVHEVKINNGWRSYGISLDTMFNRAKATYELLISGSATGLRNDTLWYQNDASIAEFGVHEKVYPLVAVSSDAAEADVLTRLDKSKYPTAIADLEMRQDEGYSVEMTCRGWWDTLDFKYYDNSALIDETIEDQIVDMISDGGFTENVYLQCTATTMSSPYREGDYLLKDTVEQLMNIGTDNSLRILAYFTKYRECFLVEEPDVRYYNYYLDRNNQLYDAYGVMVDATECKVGVWAALMDFTGVPVGTVTMIPPSPIFIERAIYNVEEGKYQPEQRGYKSPYDEIQDVQR